MAGCLWGWGSPVSQPVFCLISWPTRLVTPSWISQHRCIPGVLLGHLSLLQPKKDPGICLPGMYQAAAPLLPPQKSFTDVLAILFSRPFLYTFLVTPETFRTFLSCSSWPWLSYPSIRPGRRSGQRKMAYTTVGMFSFPFFVHTSKKMCMGGWGGGVSRGSSDMLKQQWAVARIPSSFSSLGTLLINLWPALLFLFVPRI